VLLHIALIRRDALRACPQPFDLLERHRRER
jgi:hypothetical protein